MMFRCNPRPSFTKRVRRSASERKVHCSFKQDEAGSSLIEAALSLVVFLSLIMGVVGASSLAYTKQFITFAARQAGRYAAVRGSTFAAYSCSTARLYGCQATATDVDTYVKSLVSLGLSIGNVTTSTTWPGVAGSGISCLSLNGSNSPGCTVRVTVQYRFTYALPFLPAGVTTLQSVSQMTILQ